MNKYKQKVCVALRPSYYGCTHSAAMPTGNGMRPRSISLDRLSFFFFFHVCRSLLLYFFPSFRVSSTTRLLQLKSRRQSEVVHRRPSPKTRSTQMSVSVSVFLWVFLCVLNERNTSYIVSDAHMLPLFNCKRKGGWVRVTF